jgi:hypothetical protein
MTMVTFAVWLWPVSVDGVVYIMEICSRPSGETYIVLQDVWQGLLEMRARYDYLKYIWHLVRPLYFIYTAGRISRVYEAL